MSEFETEGCESLAERLERLEQAAAEELEHDDSQSDQFPPYEIAAESRQDGQSAREYSGSSLGRDAAGRHR